MHIEKLATRHFEQYEVYSKSPRQLPRSFWQWLTRQPVEIGFEEFKLNGVIEADDKAGLVVQQVLDSDGNEVYTNGQEDIMLDNTAKLLLMVPPIRAAFHANKFVPKLVRTYNESIVIKFKGNPQPDTIVVKSETEALSEDKA